MKKVKYHLGFHLISEVKMDDFKEKTKEDYPYKQTINNESVAFGICPICENTVRLLGIYKPLSDKSVPHARHTKKNIDGFNEFSEAKYLHCPYHRKHSNYVIEVKRKEMNDEDVEVLEIAKNNFDRCIYLIQKSIGLVISDSFAEKIATDYINKYGYMTYDRTRENIPWIMLMDMPAFSPWKRIIIKDSPLYKLLKRNKVEFEKTDNDNYLRVTKDNHLNVCPIKYQFSVIDDVLHEYITLCITMPDGIGTYYEVDSLKIELSPFAFNNLVHSKKETYRKQSLLDIASKVMKI